MMFCYSSQNGTRQHIDTYTHTYTHTHIYIYVILANKEIIVLKLRTEMPESSQLTVKGNH